MSSYLLVTMPLTGHVLPALPIARALVAKGHRVSWYTGSKFRERVESTGALYLPMRHGHDFDDADLGAAFPGRNRHEGVDQFRYDLERVFIDGAAGHFDDLLELMREAPPDVMIGDTAVMALSLVSEHTRIPFAHFGISALTLPSRDVAPFGMGLLPSASPLGRLRNRALHWLVRRAIFPAAQRRYDALRRRCWLKPHRDRNLFESAFSPYLFLHGTVPGFEYPRSDLPPQVHFIGPLPAEPSEAFQPPAWWSDLESSRPVVHVTQGTAATNPAQLIDPAIRALCEEDVLVVACTGRPFHAARRASLPRNVRVERFLPYAELLPHVDVMVTNGGFGGVQQALSHGIPLVAAGTTEDKPEICNRIAWSGAGLNLGTGKPTPHLIRAAVRAVLRVPRYRQRALQLRAEIARYDAPLRAVALLEELAVTRRPVHGPARLRETGLRAA